MLQQIQKNTKLSNINQKVPVSSKINPNNRAHQTSRICLSRICLTFDNWYMPSLSAGMPRDPFMKACELTGKHSIRVPEQILLDCAINESVSDYLTTILERILINCPSIRI